MLINCPKCGFSQPKDRYCASCGVDMDNFRPTAPPAWKKVVSNPFLHVGFIFILVFVSILFIRKQQRDELRARVEYLKGGPVLVERQQAVAATQASESTEQITEMSAGENDLPQPTPEQNQAALSSALNAAANAPAPDSAAPSTTVAAQRAALAGTMANVSTTANVAANVKMTVTYAEVDTNTLNTWFDEMRAAGQLRPFDNVMMGSLNQAANKIKAASSFKSLQKIERTLDSNNATAEWFAGTHHGGEPETEMGLFSSLTLIETTNGLFRGEVEIQRAFRDPKDPTKTMDRVSFGGPFELTPGTAYLMAGLIPRQYVADLPQDQNPDAFLSIFKSQAFINRQTEFTLLIEFDTSAP